MRPHFTCKFAELPALFACAVLALGIPQNALADEAKPGVISVSATGKASAAPDMAIVDLAVVREAATAGEALRANTEAMAQVLAAMQTSGINERDLQTSNFNIQPKYFYPRRKNNGEQEQPRITGYTVTNALRVRIRDLAQVGTILDQAVTLGVNSGGGIMFTIDQPDAVLEEARKKAMQKALAKARTLATSAEVNLGRIVEISESSRGFAPRRKAMARMQADSMEAAAPVPVASGENTYSVTVNVRWELDQ